MPADFFLVASFSLVPEGARRLEERFLLGLALARHDLDALGQTSLVSDLLEVAEDVVADSVSVEVLGNPLLDRSTLRRGCAELIVNLKKKKCM